MVEVEQMTASGDHARADARKTKKQLIDELRSLRRRVSGRSRSTPAGIGQNGLHQARGLETQAAGNTWAAARRVIDKDGPDNFT
jgi:hypothetical protein